MRNRWAGLEIDATSLRMAIFDGTAKNYRLVDYIDKDIRAESEEERADIVREILTNVLSLKENKGMEVTTSIDARTVILREILVPYTREDLIAKTIRFEAESYLHSLTVEDVVVEYLKCGEKDEKSRLILCALPKVGLQKHLDLLRPVGIDPHVIELDATALATCFSNTPLYTGQQTVLLVQLEPTYSRLVLLEKDRVVKIRSFWDRSAMDRQDRLLPAAAGQRAGGAAGDGRPASPARGATHIERSFEEIERALSIFDRPGEPNGGGMDADDADVPICVVPDDEYDRLVALRNQPVAPAATPPPLVPALATAEGDPMERVITEIDRTFAAYSLTGSIELVVVTGARAVRLDAAHRLAEHYEIEVVPFDFGDSFPIAWDGDRTTLNERGAVACGLGMRSLGRGFTRFDLRKDEFRFERRFAQMMPSLLLSGLLLWLLAVAWSFHMYNGVRIFENEIRVLRDQQKGLYEAFFGETLPPGELPKPTAEKKLRELKGDGGKGDTIKEYVSMLELLNDITESIKRAKVVNEKVYPVYMGFKMAPEKNKNSITKLRLRVKSEAEASAVETSLNHLKYLRVTKPSISPDPKTGEYELSYDLKFKDEFLK